MACADENDELRLHRFLSYFRPFPFRVSGAYAFQCTALFYSHPRAHTHIYLGLFFCFTEVLSAVVYGTRSTPSTRTPVVACRFSFETGKKKQEEKVPLSAEER